MPEIRDVRGVLRHRGVSWRGLKSDSRKDFLLGYSDFDDLRSCLVLADAFGVISAAFEF